MSRRRGGSRRKKDPYVCPSCGTRVEEPEKTWTLISPLPDKYGRITMTIMASFKCPSCGKSWNAAIHKEKVGGEEKPGAAGEKREGEVIVIDPSELDDVEPLT